MAISGRRCMRSNHLLTLLLLALALTMSEPVANHGGNAQAEAAGPGECTFAENPACTGGFNIQCAEIDSSTHPGYKEEFVCCPAISQFVDRICLGPGVMTPCGMTGPRGCAVCSAVPYDRVCHVVAADDQMLIGIYRDATSEEVQVVKSP
jgi:hypothetical protein